MIKVRKLGYDLLPSPEVELILGSANEPKTIKAKLWQGFIVETD